MNDLYSMGFLDGQVVASTARIKLLETLIYKYATHVGNCEGVSFLEDQYREASSAPFRFTDEEWEAIRLIAKEDEG